MGQVELDAVEPKKLQRLCLESIESIFDFNLYDELKSIESDEKEEYKASIKRYIQSI